ncbi:MAG TPA: methyltransferase domain-containing protein [Xanthobacteraceae bacterium]|nr:methyltransferase domain-containing protein [Xanthobacteraceae bacterium]
MAVPINRNLAVERKTDFGRWSNPESLEPAWDQRAAFAAEFIPDGARVLDLGCGRMALQQFLPNACSYQPCDLVARNASTIVCDFNAGEFPETAADEADLITMLGVLEYIVDVDAFLGRLRHSKRDIVLSYCPTDFSRSIDRPSLGWINHFSLCDLAVLLDRFGFRVERADRVDDLQIVMKLRQSSRPAPLAPCRVAVVSYYDVGNFGDRLGYHIINSLIPAEAEVHHLTFKTLQEARQSYDLVVLGIGNSIFKELLNDDLLSMVKSGKAAIGIFGTQYRELTSRPAMNRLLDRLDTWFARYEEDVLQFGRGRSNVVHLGDWLISQFPMVKAFDDAPLQIGDEVLLELSLDRTIQKIQRHKNVFSTRLHPLLCALTSAELVAYAEQPRPDMPNVVSGKFRSMLIDIFGRTFPEKKFFIVDREAVKRYKSKVQANVALVGQRIETILRNVAVAAA